MFFFWGGGGGGGWGGGFNGKNQEPLGQVQGGQNDFWNALPDKKTSWIS